MKKQKTRILFLLHLPPPVHGSSMVGKWIRESKLINENFDARYINLLASKSIQETGHVSAGKIFGFVKIWFRIFFELLLHRRPALCYLAMTTTGAAFYRDTLVILLLKVFRVKRVYHLHNKGVIKNARKKFNSVLYRFAFRGADVIVLSKFLYRDIKMFVPGSRVHICPNGIPVFPKQIARKEPEHVPEILFLSNLMEAKGVYILLEAARILKNRGYEFNCIFVGGESDITREKFQKMVAELNLKNYARYLGKKVGEEKEHILEEADIFSLPTFYNKECSPLVLLEAMRNNLPIVATREGGIPSLVDDESNGFLVPQEDAVLLAEKLAVLITNPALRKKMGEAGKKKFESRYTLHHFENRIVRIFENILDPGRNTEVQPDGMVFRRPFLGLELSSRSYQRTVDDLVSLAGAGISSYACVANVHMCMEAYHHPEFAKAVNGADLITPDGMPIAKGIELFYKVHQERVCGMDLLPDLLKASEDSGIKVFFYGGTCEALEKTKKYCSQYYPGLSIAGMISPPFRKLTAEEEQSHVDTINNSGAGFLFVALGCPKQEKWMAEMKGRINACMVGIGGALPVMVGMQKRAPLWMQHSSLEWLFRLMQEPRRLFKRYAVTNTLFVCLVLWNWARQGFRPLASERLAVGGRGGAAQLPAVLGGVDKVSRTAC
ncbi:MAG: WecB/TagA/CpsF family glycosyltransferase [Chitinophagaceae bacterium]|nr:WecB/TagA/CpsF family glycosyltransferase [Chitinophagaceae bacterium]